MMIFPTWVKKVFPATANEPQLFNMPEMYHPARLWMRHFKEAIKVRNDGVVIVSYPKSGRTWHRAALGYYLSTLVGGNPVEALDTRDFTRRYGLPNIAYSHNSANFLAAIGPDHYLNGSRAIWKNRKIVLLVREPRDVIVSSFFHAKYRSKTFNGTLSQFIRHPYTGIDKWITAHLRWKSYFPETLGVLVQTYEGMHKDHNNALKNVIEFIGLGAVNEIDIVRSVEFSSLENMKQLENPKFLGQGRLNSDVGNGSWGMKVREGKTEGYLNHMSDADLEFVQNLLKVRGHPFGKEIAECVY